MASLFWELIPSFLNGSWTAGSPWQQVRWQGLTWKHMTLAGSGDTLPFEMVISLTRKPAFQYNGLHVLKHSQGERATVLESEKHGPSPSPLLTALQTWASALSHCLLICRGARCCLSTALGCVGQRPANKGCHLTLHLPWVNNDF